jgi:hypothetical protein
MQVHPNPQREPCPTAEDTTACRVMSSDGFDIVNNPPRTHGSQTKTERPAHTECGILKEIQCGDTRTIWEQHPYSHETGIQPRLNSVAHQRVPVAEKEAAPPRLRPPSTVRAGHTYPLEPDERLTSRPQLHRSEIVDWGFREQFDCRPEAIRFCRRFAGPGSSNERSSREAGRQVDVTDRHNYGLHPTVRSISHRIAAAGESREKPRGPWHIPDSRTTTKRPFTLQNARSRHNLGIELRGRGTVRHSGFWFQSEPVPVVFSRTADHQRVT